MNSMLRRGPRAVRAPDFIKNAIFVFTISVSFARPGLAQETEPNPMRDPPALPGTPRLCRGGSRSLTVPGMRGSCRAVPFSDERAIAGSRKKASC
jgi:hypothetical protein